MSNDYLFLDDINDMREILDRIEEDLEGENEKIRAPLIRHEQ